LRQLTVGVGSSLRGTLPY